MLQSGPRLAAFRQSRLATKVPMPKGGKDQELPDTDSRFLRLVDSTLDLQSRSHQWGYYTNRFSGESKVSYLLPGCAGSSVWQRRWQQVQRNFTRVWPRSGDYTGERWQLSLSMASTQTLSRCAAVWPGFTSGILFRPAPISRRATGKPRLKHGSSNVDSGVNRTPFRRANIGVLPRKQVKTEGESRLVTLITSTRSPNRACHPYLQPTQECVYQGRRSCSRRLPVSRAGAQIQIAKHPHSACARGRPDAVRAETGEAPQPHARGDLFRSEDFLK